MDPYKQFGTPIAHVTFRLNGEDVVVLTNVVERWINDLGGSSVVIMRDDQGAYMAVQHWDAMIQAPGHSFF